MRRVLDYGQDVCLRAAEQVDGEEGRARMASAWERRNCDQVSLSGSNIRSCGDLLLLEAAWGCQAAI